MSIQHSSERWLFGGCAMLFVYFQLCPVSQARLKPLGFPIPAKLLSFGQAVTPREYGMLRLAIMKNWEREKAKVLQEGPGMGSDFTHITASRIQLGSLGEGFVVNFSHSSECGATGNCPMEVYVRGPQEYRRVIAAGGWGYALIPSGGSVPDIAFYWNMSCCESDAQVFHYAKSRFVPKGGAACRSSDNWRSVVPPGPICAPIARGGASSSMTTISPAEYAVLRSAVEANPGKRSVALSRRFPFDEARAVIVHGGTAVGLGPCGFNRNCIISIYAQSGKTGPLLRNANGWGVASVNEVVSQFPQFRSGIVIARRLSASEDELTRYSATATTRTEGYTSSSLLLPDACEIVTPKTGKWPTHWDASALVARPVYCFKPSPSVAQIPAADPTDVSSIVQDSSGAVWAIGPGTSGSPALYEWVDDGWGAVPSPIHVATSSPRESEFLSANGEGPQPIGLWKGPNGGVLVFWNDPGAPQNSELVWQRGDQTSKVANLPSAIPEHGIPAAFQFKTALPAPLGTILPRIEIEQKGGFCGAVGALLRRGLGQ